MSTQDVSDPNVVTDEDFARLLEFRAGLRRFLHWSEHRAKEVGLTATQHQLLLAVRGHGGPPSVSELAEHLDLRHHSTVELVDRAVHAGLVSRSADTEDQRVVRVVLTAEGESRLRDLSVVHLAELSRIGPKFAAFWRSLPTDGQHG